MAGFQVSHPFAWLLEGFLFYLPQEQIARLLGDITSLAVSGSWLGFDIINHALLISPWTILTACCQYGKLLLWNQQEDQAIL